MLTFPSAPPSCATPVGHKFVWPRLGLNLNWLTFLKSQPSLPVRDVTHVPGHILYLGFLCDISEWHARSARTLTPALMLHLTNPCAKRKVLSLTKPKGKIYKTKSLGHYITQWPLHMDAPMLADLQGLKYINSVRTLDAV